MEHRVQRHSEFANFDIERRASEHVKCPIMELVKSTVKSTIQLYGLYGRGRHG